MAPPQQPLSRRSRRDIAKPLATSYQSKSVLRAKSATPHVTHRQTQPLAHYCRPASADTYHNGPIATRDPLAGTSFTRQKSTNTLLCFRVITARQAPCQSRITTSLEHTNRGQLNDRHVAAMPQSVSAIEIGPSTC